jgi:bacteriocin-type transport-associated protein
MRRVLFIFGALNDDDIEWMMEAGHREEFSVGLVLVQEGEPVDTIYIVLQGKLAVLAQALGGQEVARLAAGEIVGEMSFIDARPPSTTVKAIEDTVVLSIPRDKLSVKLEQDAYFAARFYRAIAVSLSDRLRHTMDYFGGRVSEGLNEDVFEEDELDPEVLDNVYLAGIRFDRMLKRMMKT